MKKQRGFSLIELLVVIAIVLILAAIAIPNLLRTRIAANEASSVGSMRTLFTSESAYNLTYGGYADTLTKLGPVPFNGTVGSATAGLIDPALAAGVKAGYNFNLTDTDTVGPNSTSSKFLFTATPSSSATGNRQFCVSMSGSIMQLASNATLPTTGADCESLNSPI